MIKRSLLAAFAITALVATYPGAPPPAEARRNDTLCGMLYRCLYQSEDFCGMTTQQAWEADQYYDSRC